MTVITAMHDESLGVTWLGSNSRATIGSFVGPSVDRKWFAIEDWAIGITGSGPKLEALQAATNSFPEDVKYPFEIIKFVKGAYEAFDIGELDEGLKRYLGGGLLVHKSGAVWDFDNSFCVTEVPKGGFWARGSGMDLAIGAATALRSHVKSAEDITRRGLEIVIDIDVDCPGEPLVQSFNMNAELSEPKIA